MNSSVDREARFDAIFGDLDSICKGERAIPPDEQELFRELRGWAARLDAARQSEDLDAVSHYLDEVILLGDTILGRLLAQGFRPEAPPRTAC